jgi:hypothetical protein
MAEFVSEKFVLDCVLLLQYYDGVTKFDRSVPSPFRLNCAEMNSAMLGHFRNNHLEAAKNIVTNEVRGDDDDQQLEPPPPRHSSYDMSDDMKKRYEHWQIHGGILLDDDGDEIPDLVDDNEDEIPDLIDENGNVLR